MLMEFGTSYGRKRDTNFRYSRNVKIISLDFFAKIIAHYPYLPTTII